jgi:hypothetical protein
MSRYVVECLIHEATAIAHALLGGRRVGRGEIPGKDDISTPEPELSPGGQY